MTSNIDDYFEGYDADANAEERARTATGRYWDYSNFGTYRFRMLPVPKGSGRSHPWISVHKHWARFPNNRFEPILCNKLAPIALSAAFRGKCYGCEWQAALRRRGNPIDLKTADSLDVTVQAYAEIIDRKAEAAGTQIMRFGVTILNQLMALREDKELCGYDFTHPKHGVDLLLSVQKQKGGNKQFVLTAAQSGPTPLARSREAIIEIFETRPGLESELVYESFEETKARIQAAMNGEKTQRDRDFVIDPSAVRGALGTPSNGAAKHEPEDDFELPDDEEDFPQGAAAAAPPSGDYKAPPHTEDDIPF